MGQKVNPVGLRIGINKGWQSRWFATRDYAKLLKEDILIRDMIEEQLGNASISRIEMERTAEEVKIDMYTAKPGMVIGRRGATINDIRQSIEEATGNIIQLNIIEIKKPELVANLVAESIANQLLGRVSFRRAMTTAISLSLKAGAKGVKIQCSGRLGGAEMARTEWYREGRVPLHTLRANIDYGFAEANTTFGKIGVKVWIYLGDVILDEEEGRTPEAADKAKERPRRAPSRLKDRVKKGTKKIKEMRKTVISAGLKSGQEAEEAKQDKAEKKEAEKSDVKEKIEAVKKPATAEKEETAAKEEKAPEIKKEVAKEKGSKVKAAKAPEKKQEEKKAEAKDSKDTEKSKKKTVTKVEDKGKDKKDAGKKKDSK